MQLTLVLLRMGLFYTYFHAVIARSAQVLCLAGSSTPLTAEALPQQPEMRPPPSPLVERPGEDDRPEMASPISQCVSPPGHQPLLPNMEQLPLPPSPEHLGSSSMQQSVGSAASEEDEEVSSKLMDPTPETPVGGIHTAADMEYSAGPVAVTAATSDAAMEFSPGPFAGLAATPGAATGYTADPSAIPAAAPDASMSAGSVGSCASRGFFLASPVDRPALDFASPGISLASGDEASEAPSPDPGYAAGEGDGAALKRHRPG